MSIKKIIIGIFLSVFALSPLIAQVQPGDADHTVTEVIEEHDNTSVAKELFDSEFETIDSKDESVAFFAPEDEVLNDQAGEEVSAEQLKSLFEGHLAKGIASREPLEYIEWFATESGEKITVSTEDDAVILNDSVEVVDAIPTKNGVVYVIDGALK